MTRRQAILSGFAPLAGAAAPLQSGAAGSQKVERWGVFEAQLPGPSSGTPYTEVKFAADFKFEHRMVAADGFYDGGGRVPGPFLAG